MDNGILAYTPWDPSLYLQSTHLHVRHVIKELSLTYLHMSVQTTSFFLMTYNEYTQLRRWLYLRFMPKQKRNCSVSWSISGWKKNPSSSAAGPATLRWLSPVRTAFRLGKNSTAAINLIQEALHLSVSFRMLCSFPTGFSLTRVNPYSTADTQSLPSHLIAWMTLVNQTKIKELSGYTWALQSYHMPRTPTAWLASYQEWKSWLRHWKAKAFHLSQKFI